jgi:predicted nuclease of predicted toxin-antitoxin system
LAEWKLVQASSEELTALEALFRGKSRFLVDEDLGAEVAEFVRSQGYNTVYAKDVGLAGHPDENVFNFAYSADRIVLTHNGRHFLDDRRFPPHRNPGVIVLPGAEGQAEPLVRALVIALAFIGNLRKFMRETKMVIDEQGLIKVRHRDFETGAMQTHRYKWRSGRLFIEESAPGER